MRPETCACYKVSTVVIDTRTTVSTIHVGVDRGRMHYGSSLPKRLTLIRNGASQGLHHLMSFAHPREVALLRGHLLGLCTSQGCVQRRLDVRAYNHALIPLAKLMCTWLPPACAHGST